MSLLSYIIMKNQAVLHQRGGAIVIPHALLELRADNSKTHSGRNRLVPAFWGGSP